MRTTLAQLLSDFLAAIVFLAIYGLTDNLYWATGAAIAVSLAVAVFPTVRWLRLRRRVDDKDDGLGP